jgi:very-short-patch-repair endonuclease
VLPPPVLYAVPGDLAVPPSLGDIVDHEDSSEDFARRLRRNMTFPERRLWSRIRNRQLGDVKFLRQIPIEDYFVEFVSRELKLIVELDGDSHNGRGAYDQQRHARLKSLGYSVVRISNDDVIRNIETVLEGLVAVVIAR